MDALISIIPEVVKLIVYLVWPTLTFGFLLLHAEGVHRYCRGVRCQNKRSQEQDFVW
jgi:hypothetical protein